MKKKIIAGLTLMALAGFAHAGSGKVSFQDLDANRDGQISLDEAVKSPDVSQKFGQADANKDGKLDAAEFAALESSPKDGQSKSTK